MKRFIGFLLCITLLAMTACGKSKTDVNQKEVYKQINSLVDGYECDSLSYQVVLSSEDMKLTLHNTGSLVKEKDTYKYTYSYQYLNKIGSGADSLISTESGSIEGSSEEIFSKGFAVSEDVKVVSLKLKDSFKSYDISLKGDSYVMKGYLARNTIIKNTDNLDDDIRFYYELTVSKDLTRIEKLVITYATVNFDSVVITIIFKEA